MYYSLFEGTPFEGKEKLGEQFYKSLFPLVQKVDGFHGDSLYMSTHNPRKAINIAIWENEDAMRRWRNEENHLRVQAKGSKTVYESLRVRVGPVVDDEVSAEQDGSRTKQFVTLFYKPDMHGTPLDDVTSLLDSGAASDLKDDVVESIVYQGTQNVWITAWKTADAANRFAKTVGHEADDKLLHLRIERDYTKSDRNDAPHEIPGESV